MKSGRYARIGMVTGVALLAATLVGCSLGGAKSNTGSAGNSGITAGASASPSPVVASPPAGPSPSATTGSSHTAAPAPTKKPPAAKPGQCPRTPTTVGKSQSARTILAELEHAHTVNEYAKMDPSELDNRLNGKTPNVHIPLTILKAVAAQESGWTSNCVSSDGTGGFGTMQMQAATSDTSNLKLATAYNRLNQTQNVLLGNEWLEYLTVHFGIEYFHNNFNLLSTKTVKGVDLNGNTIHVTLRDAVFAAYNTGLGFVDPSNGAKPIYIGPKGEAYVQSVNGLMAPSQPNQRSWGR